MSTSDLRKYFNKRKPLGAVVLVIFGILLFLLGISINGGNIWAVIGSCISGLGIFFIIRYNKNHSDLSVDAFCNSLANDYYALQKNIVNSLSDTIVDELYSSSYNFDNVFRARVARRGKDNRWRSSIFEMNCLFFSADNIYYFNKRISLITDERYEKQKELRNTDIQMVSIEEYNQSVVIVIAISGNDKVFINCKNKEIAVEIREKIKVRMGGSVK